MSAIPADCIARVGAAMGAKANAQALAYVQKQLAQFTQGGGTPSQQLQQAAARFQQKVQLAAVIQKTNAARNAIKYGRAFDYVTRTWAGKEAEGLRAMLTGSIEGRKGARSSAAREQVQLQAQYTGGLVTEMERAGVGELFASGALDRDVAHALYQLNSAQPNLAGIPGEAVTIARIVSKWQELARVHANNEGAWIGKLDGWVVRQSHDLWKIDKAGFPEWATYIGARLDWLRIEAEQGPIPDKARWLREVYTNLASGTHIKAPGAQNTSGFKGPANLAKQMSAERLLHFKDADAWFDYNQRFGAGNVREAVFAGLRRSAQNTGLMRTFGTNPQAMFDRLVDEIGLAVRNRGDEKAIRKWHTATADQGWLRNRLAEVTGEAQIPVSRTLARVASNVRVWESMAKLGGATLSSFPDIATYASEMKFQGRGFLSGMAEALGAVGQGRPTGERREILASLGVFFDSMIGEIGRVGSLDETFGGSMSRGLRTFFKYNLLDWWTDSLRSSAALSMSHTLAQKAGKRFADLPPELRHTLDLFDIGDADWNAIRSSVRQAADGRRYAVPDGLAPDIADKLRRYISDRAQTAILEPDLDTRAMLRQGTKAGTINGELLRFMAQFKSYGTGFARQVVGREIYGRGPEAWAKGSASGLAQLIVATTMLGYASMVAKDLAKGRTPRDPTDYHTITAAMMQGGGAGIYGDYLFGQYNRFGGSPLETAAGPTLGSVADALQLFGRWREGDAGAAEALRLGVNNTPFLNLFYTRAAFDYLFLYHVQEAINPGAMARMEARVAREQHQTYLLPPSDVVR